MNTNQHKNKKKAVYSASKFCLRATSFALFFFFAFALSSCKKNKSPVYDASSINIEISNGNVDDLSPLPSKWHVTNKRIIVLFGYDFNTSEQTKPLLDMLQENYGLHSEDGLIYPLVYPTDFKHGTRGYSTDFSTILNEFENEISGIVILGAPENTHKALAKNQDRWNQEMPYPIVALFPQDDILGLESTCDIVIDKGQAAKETELSQEETVSQLITEAPEILQNTIDYMISLNYSLPKNTTIQSHVSQMLNGRKFHNYADPETGLKSINHFVLN